MPTYCYKNKKGDGIIKVFSISKKNEVEKKDNEGKKYIKEKGDIFYRDLQAEYGSRHYRGKWPMYSEAIGVLPEQRFEAMKESENLGIPTYYDSQGRAKLTNSIHRKKLCERLGFYDRNSYGTRIEANKK